MWLKFRVQEDEKVHRKENGQVLVHDAQGFKHLGKDSCAMVRTLDFQILAKTAKLGTQE